MSRIGKAVLIASLSLVVATEAGAAGPGSSGPTPYPVGLTTLPVESGLLRSHADFQFLFSRASLSAGAFSADLNVIALALQAQIALMDRFEVGLTVPFLIHGLASVGNNTSSSTDFGNVQLDLKVKLLGGNKSGFGLSLFANTIFPTATNLSSRELLGLQSGVAGTGLIGRKIAVGGVVGTFYVAGPGEDLLAFLFDGWIAFQPMRLLAVQLLFQMGIPIKPDGGDPAVSVTPALQFFPLPRFHIDLGVRLGLNDGGKALYAYFGRAALTLAAGYIF